MIINLETHVLLFKIYRVMPNERTTQKLISTPVNMIIFISPRMVVSQQYSTIYNTEQWNLINNVNLTKLE